jgi:predicted GTPase
MAGLLANFEARLSIFYTDFKRRGVESTDIDIIKVLNVDKNMLQNAINKLEKAVNELL